MHQYTVSQPTADVSYVLRDDGFPVPWSDPDFQAWNASQPVPYTLSTAQQTIQTLKQLTFTQWQNNVTAAQKDRILYELVQRALKSEIV